MLINFVCIVPVLLLTTLLSLLYRQGNRGFGFPRWLSSKESACNAGDSGLPSLGRENMEEDMAIHSSILAWRIPWTEEPGGLQSMGSRESQTGLGN